jgi:hypothetical protein
MPLCISTLPHIAVEEPDELIQNEGLEGEEIIFHPAKQRG